MSVGSDASSAAAIETLYGVTSEPASLFSATVTGHDEGSLMMKTAKRKYVNTTSAPGKRHLESTNPFSEPRNVEMSVAGMTSLKLFARFGERSCQAVRQAAIVQTCGNDQAWLGSVSATPFRLV